MYIEKVLDLKVDQVVDCGLWNVGPLIFNSCAKLLDIGVHYHAAT